MNPDDCMHIVGRFSVFVNAFRPGTLRALCGFNLVTDSYGPDPKSAPWCPECVRLDGEAP